MPTIFRSLSDPFAQLLVIVYPPVFVFWILFHTRIDYWRTMGKRAYWYTSVGWPLISLPLLYFRRELFQLRWDEPWWLEGLGGVALVCAGLVGFAAARTISHNTLIGLAELEPQKNAQPLMQSGIYGLTRNPVYLTHWLLIVAAALLTGYAASWIFLAIDVVALAILIRYEEKELIARYGEGFRQYMRRVPRFFPSWL